MKAPPIKPLTGMWQRGTCRLGQDKCAGAMASRWVNAASSNTWDRQRWCSGTSMSSRQAQPGCEALLNKAASADSKCIEPTDSPQHNTDNGLQVWEEATGMLQWHDGTHFSHWSYHGCSEVKPYANTALKWGPAHDGFQGLSDGGIKSLVAWVMFWGGHVHRIHTSFGRAKA